MDEVDINVDEKGNGTFSIKDGEQQVAEMVFDISAGDLTVFHTEVIPDYEGEGLAKKLLYTMVDYARSHHLKVIAFCPFVHEMFARDPVAYADIWKNNKN